MSSLSHCFGLILGAALPLASGAIQSQSEEKPRELLDDAVIVKLAPIEYPALARQVRITGNVELNIRVQPDGTVGTAAVVSGHPLLARSAVDNVKQSRFECKRCSEKSQSYRMVYTFDLRSSDKKDGDDRAASRDPQHPGLTVSHSMGHVVVTDWPIIISDPGPDPLKVRSLKCLYLWKCNRVL